MALAFHTDTRSLQPTGVVWSTRRTHLVVVTAPGAGRSTPVTTAQYRRRRVVAALAATMVVALLASVVFTIAGWADRSVGEPLGRPGGAGASGLGWATGDDGVARYVVASGDSLWSVAGRYDGAGDVGTLVEELVDRLGTSRIVPGQVLEIRP